MDSLWITPGDNETHWCTGVRTEECTVYSVSGVSVEKEKEKRKREREREREPSIEHTVNLITPRQESPRYGVS